MLTSSATYKEAIKRAPNPHFEVDLYDGDGTLLQQAIPVHGGDVTANLTHRVTRTGNIRIGEAFYSLLPTAVFTPYRTVAVIKAGIRYGDGSTELFTILTGRVYDASRGPDGEVRGRIDDRAADVVAFQFEQPRNSENVSIISQIERLISEALPDAVFGPHDVVDATTPKLTWDEDRGKALDDLAGAVGGRWYALGDGTFVVRQYPYDVGTVVQTIEDGTLGLLHGATPSITRDGAANSVTVVVERFDGGVPFRVTARDTSPTSPTLWGGPFGRVTKIIKVQTPLTVGQATTYARAQLSASTALSSQWSVDMTPDYTLEPGDTVRFGSRGVRETQLIDSIRYPLGPGPMTLSTRAFVRAPVTVE